MLKQIQATVVCGVCKQQVQRLKINATSTQFIADAWCHGKSATLRKRRKGISFDAAESGVSLFNFADGWLPFD